LNYAFIDNKPSFVGDMLLSAHTSTRVWCLSSYKRDRCWTRV